MTLGERIQTWRKAQRLNQQDLAEACGITVSAVSLWECDETSPSQKHLVKVVALFGITMERFYGRLPAVPKDLKKKKAA